MRIEITLDGKTYKSATTNEMTYEKAAEMIYEELEKVNKFKIALEDGGILLLPIEAIRKAHIVFYS